MSDCTPDETDLLDCYAGMHESNREQSYDDAYTDAERVIAEIKTIAKAETRADFVLTRANIRKIKADALREAAEALPAPVGLSCNAGCHDADRLALRIRADRIEGEA